MGALAFCAPAVLFASEGALPKAAEPLPVLKNFPQPAPEAVYKNVEKMYAFDASGVCEFRQRTELRVNTLFAMNELCGETFIVYNPNFQRVKVHSAYTIMADGVTRVDVPENAFNTVLPKCAADAPAFNFLRELVITHTALEPGATIFLDYSVFHAADSGMLYDEYADMPFPCERLVMNFNGATTEYFNVPARSREKYFTAQKTVPVIYPGMPATTPRNLCSTENIELGDVGKKILAGLIDERMTTPEKHAAIIRFVQEQIATIPIPSRLLLESDLRNPDEVLKSAYGTPLEKARLLCAMFGDDAEILHDPVEDTFSVKYIGFSELPIALTPEKSAIASIGIKAICEWNDGKETIRGTADGVLVKPAMKKAADAASDWLGKRKENLNAEWTPEGRLSFSFERDTSSRQGTLLWQVPVSPKGIAASDFGKLPTERKSELKIPSCGETFHESYSYSLRIPEGWELAGGAQYSEILTPLGRVVFSVALDGAEVSVSKELSLRKASIPPEEYAKFRSLMTVWFAPENNRLLFIKKTKEN